MNVVNEGAPLGIVGAIRANEANQVCAIGSYLDELILRRVIERLAPHTEPFLR
jgi:hypothetical protein